MDGELESYFEQDEVLADLNTDELVKKLEDGSALETIRTSPEWKIFIEVWRRIYNEAERQLDHADPADTVRIIQAQLTKKFYRDVLSTTIMKVKEDAKAAFEQAKDVGILGKISTVLKKDV